MLRILIADDHSLFRRGVKDLLADGLEDVTVGECANAYDLMEQVRQKQWDLVILDIGMPGTTGTDALRLLKAERPGLPVIVLSMHPEDQYAVRMFKAGANAYLTKASAPEELVTAVKKVSAGGQYVGIALGEKLVYMLRPGHDGPLHDLLSDREYEVMRFLASGKTVSEIADTMHLGVTTVSTYRSRILEKLHLKNNAELMHYALRQGLA
ncbi:Response regulator, LuxR family [Nitrospira sp. KM1]|uniref:response regulator n=1 Tax=Nitrospira sp. KM1 TaxID=1936990 RepID=UPI0013A75124|nr:response regulator transcription factor [Nitrospira sp. KM1]BCA54571.1 Response regulator, LuxR family [Nitrospira sp. KM1]